jgi:hypothetical protein
MNEHAIYKAAGQQGLRPSFATMGRQWGREILDLIDVMWSQEPASRPRMPQVLVQVEKMLAERKNAAK